MTDTYIHVRATTNAKREFVELKNGKYHITVKEKAEAGKANKRIVTLLAQTLSCNQKALHLVTGGTRTSKTFLLNNHTNYENKH